MSLKVAKANFREGREHDALAALLGLFDKYDTYDREKFSIEVLRNFKLYLIGVRATLPDPKDMDHYLKELDTMMGNLETIYDGAYLTWEDAPEDLYRVS